MFIRPSPSATKQNNNSSKTKFSPSVKSILKEAKEERIREEKLDNFLLAASKQAERREEKQQISAERVVFDIFYGSIALHSNI